jgi:hypothetical protein
MLGYGGVGQDYSDYSAHTRGRLAHFVLHIPKFISNRAFLSDATPGPPAWSCQGFPRISCAATCSLVDAGSRLANVRNLSADS